MEDGCEQTAMQNKHKHLQFLQGAINRMSGNLFLLEWMDHHAYRGVVCSVREGLEYRFRFYRLLSNPSVLDFGRLTERRRPRLNSSNRCA
jgi:hypothetical protein